MDRRTILKGGLVLAATSHTAVATAEKGPDPVLDTIRDFHDGLAKFSSVPEEDLIKDEDAIVAATYGPAQDLLLNWREPAKTREGAIAALRLMEEQDVFCSSIGEGMRLAVLGYLEALA